MVAGFVNVLDYGTPSAANFNTAAQDAASAGLDLWIPKQSSGGSYSLNSTFTVPAGVSVWQQQRMAYTGSNSTPAVVWGQAGVPNIGQTWRGMWIAGSRSWPNNYEYVGFRLINPQYCYCPMIGATDFDVGIQVLADGDDAVGTRIETHVNRYNRVTFHVRSRNGGRAYNNRLFGGRGTAKDGVDFSRDAYHILTDSLGGGSDVENDMFNMFWGTCSEFDARAHSGRVATFWLHTPYNVCWSIRCESFESEGAGNANSRYAIMSGSGAHHNTLHARWDFNNSFSPTWVSSDGGAPPNNIGFSNRRFDFSTIGGFDYP